MRARPYSMQAPAAPGSAGPAGGGVAAGARASHGFNRSPFLDGNNARYNTRTAGKIAADSLHKNAKRKLNNEPPKQMNFLRSLKSMNQQNAASKKNAFKRMTRPEILATASQWTG